MLNRYVRACNLWNRVLREEAGLTAIEYGVFAAFIVLSLSVAAFSMGPKLSAWMTTTMCGVMNGGTGGC